MSLWQRRTTTPKRQAANADSAALLGSNGGWAAVPGCQEFSADS